MPREFEMYGFLCLKCKFKHWSRGAYPSREALEEDINSHYPPRSSEYSCYCTDHSTESYHIVITEQH